MKRKLASYVRLRETWIFTRVAPAAVWLANCSAETTHFFQDTRVFARDEHWRTDVIVMLIRVGKDDDLDLVGHICLYIAGFLLHPWQWPETRRSMDDPTDFRRLSQPFDVFRDEITAKCSYLENFVHAAVTNLDGRQTATKKWTVFDRIRGKLLYIIYVILLRNAFPIIHRVIQVDGW